MRFLSTSIFFLQKCPVQPLCAVRSDLPKEENVEGGVAVSANSLARTMLAALRTARSLRVQRVFNAARCASTEAVVSSGPVDPVAKQAKSVGKRPHLGIEVDPNHGLWGFFRKKVDSEGTVSYETVEPRDAHDESGACCVEDALRHYLDHRMVIQGGRGLRQNCAVRVSKTCIRCGMSCYGNGTSLPHRRRKQGGWEFEALNHSQLASGIVW